MKLLTTIVAAALLSAAALPAIAQDTTNSQGEAITPAVPAAPTTIAPTTGSLSAISTVKVLAVADASGLVLDGGPNSALTSNPKVTDALTKGGYSGSQIIGYAMDGSDLTVYVKAG
jgi:hypothetical protein